MTETDTLFDSTESRPRRGRRAWLAGLGSLVVLGAIAFAVIHWQRGRAVDESAAIVALRAELDAMRATQRTADSARAALERRIAASEGVNRSLREEVLGVGERTRVLEEAVARLANRGLHGSAQLRLNEAEFLMSMGEERLLLFADVAGALRAFDLADAELAALDDPVHSGVRQSLAIEREALRALPPFEPSAVFAELDALSDAIAALPTTPLPMSESAAAAPTGAGLASRLGAGLSRFIRIERIGADAGPLFADPGLQRLAAQMALLRAQSAVSLGDREGLAGAAARAKLAMEPSRGRDAAHDAVLERLEILAAIPAFEPPPIGAALAQLRNLRAARAIATPPSDEGNAP
jgi:uroporphyrin-3 C-methyltransferase